MYYRTGWMRTMIRTKYLWFNFCLYKIRKHFSQSSMFFGWCKQVKAFNSRRLKENTATNMSVNFYREGINTIKDTPLHEHFFFG
jgi:hypothetical protein